MKLRICAATKVNWSFWKRIKDSCSGTLNDTEASKLTEEEVEQINSILEHVLGELAKVEAHFNAAKARGSKKEEPKKEEPKKEEPKEEK